MSRTIMEGKALNVVSKAPEGPVDMELGNFHRGLCQLEERIAMLEERLAGVLSPEYPECCEDAKKPGASGNSDMAQRLYHLNEQLGFSVDRLDRILGRVEL